jgi:magnesium-dependent phosphatase 1
MMPSPTPRQTYSPDGRTFGPYGFDSLFPKLIAFDLDYTLWSGWIDTHWSGPFRRPSPAALNTILDMNDKRLSLYPHVSHILHRLQQSYTHVAATSRTSAGELARDALALLLVSPPKERPRERPQRAIDFVESLEVYPGSKRVHFSELHKKTDIPYSEMLFFSGDPCEDTENNLVQRLGVTYFSVPAKQGLTLAVFEEGIRLWRRRRGWVDDDDDEGEGEDMDISDDDDDSSDGRVSDGAQGAAEEEEEAREEAEDDAGGGDPDAAPDPDGTPGASGSGAVSSPSASR